MINIPLSFFAMWMIMIAGILTNIMARINAINQKTPESVRWITVLQNFFRKEWASYGMSLIFTGIMAYSFQYMKQFSNDSNAEISKWAKWIPLAVLILYFIGVLNQWIFYKILGRIQTKGVVDNELIDKPKDP
jgi:hypothetical protein